jgi:uncharacterized lipoprotein YmbA
MRKAIILSFVAFLAACGTSPDPHYYSLVTENGSQDPSLNGSFKIERPTMADYLDRPDFVYSETNVRLGIDERDNWASPLDRMFAEILAADLQQRLPQSRVWAGENETSPATVVVDFDIQRFNALTDGGVVLEGFWRITNRPSGVQSVSIPIHLEVQSSGSPEAVARALSHLLGEQADQMVPALKASVAAPNPVP